MPSISLCIIVKNEEQFLEQCIASVKDVVQEIIIVDTGSTDRTVEIAKKCTAKVFSVPWQDFSKARNFALQKATGDWVLVLDADEKLSQQGAARLQNLVSKGYVLGYTVQQRNYTDDATTADMIPCEPGEGFVGYTLAKPVRLFQNKRGIWYEGKVHEGVEKSILTKQGVIEDSGIVIHHYKVLKGKQTEEEKRKAYLQLLQQQLAEKKDAKTHYELGLVYKSLGDPTTATIHLQEAAKLDEKYRQPYSSLAEVHVSEGKVEEAIAMLLKSLTVKETPADHYNLGLLYAKQKKSNEAVHHLKRAIELSPHDVRFYQMLASLFVRQKQPGKAISLMEIALKHNPDNPEVLNVLGLFYYNTDQLDKAVSHFKQALATADEAMKIKILINLGETYVAQKRLDAALTIFEQIRALHPEKAELLKCKVEELQKMREKS